ncbi:MAG: SGNH/GDSL hydrolase family protein [Firmicutes bacterium]|nr:SGNH/GDSL hydrolase family protein [Bacillota bacterium]
MDEKKKINIGRILYLIVIIALCALTWQFINFAIDYHSRPHPPTGDSSVAYLPYYHTFINYPDARVKDAGIAAFLWLTTLYLCFDFLFISGLHKWKKAVAIICSVAFIIGGTEYVMNYYDKLYPVMHRPHPTIFWRLVPDLLEMNFGPVKILTDSHGFRSPEIAEKKPAGEYRVMILGDSSAFGFFVKNNQTFGAELVKMLRQKYPGKNVKLINAAVSGYTTYQGATLMKEMGWKFSPDLIIISFNDDPQLEWKTDLERLPPPALVPFFRVLYSSKIYLTLKKELINNQLKKDNRFALRPDFKNEKSRVTPEQLKQNVSYIVENAKKSGAAVIVISMPLQSAGEYIERYRTAQKEVADANGFPVLDLLYAWQDLPADEMFFDVMHPTVKGHKVIADELYKIVLQQKWLEK